MPAGRARSVHFGDITTTVIGGTSSTTAMKDSGEDERFEATEAARTMSAA